MTVELKAGGRFQSSVCETQVVVVKAPGDPVDLRCGGQPMAPAGGDAGSGTPDPAFAEGTTMGKRYVDPDGTLELLCSKPGAGSLSIGDVALSIKDAKPLPASD